jgi:hypothetical protein
MTILRFIHLFLVLATFQWATEAFLVRKLVDISVKTLHFSASPEGDDDNNSEPSPFPQQQPVQNERELDPLIMSLTRNDQLDSESVNAPLFGEIPVDGSLVVLLPALLIGVVGFAMSINIVLNSQDAIVDSLNQISQDAAAAAVAKTNIAAPLADGCRGLCSNQEADLQGLQTFMQGIGK